MIISIASGKGGTGKTCVSTSFAYALNKINVPVQLIDCDVEEPNANLFIGAKIEHTENVEVIVPKIDEQKCTHCGKCAEFCKFNALVVYPDKVMRFLEMCHSCAGCKILCPEKAISDEKRTLGIIETGHKENIQFAHGKLNIGEARATPIINKLKQLINPTRTVILDSPPGTSCPFVETLKKSDYCILVTEPTPFGLNDLKLALEVTKEFNIPTGVIINRSDIGNDCAEKYLKDNKTELLMKIPHDMKIARGYSEGKTIIESMPEIGKSFIKLNERIIEIINSK